MQVGNGALSCYKFLKEFLKQYQTLSLTCGADLLGLQCCWKLVIAL
jgi:hypothetical protein